MSVNQKVRAGVIGVGYLGRYHAQKYAAMEGTELVGVADVDLDRAALVADECATRAFGNFRQLLAEVDAVSIAVPTIHHHRVARECLLSNVDVLLEKPITTTLAEADELIALAEEHGRILQVGHLERFNPAVLAMRPQLTQPLFIEAHRLAVFKERGTDVDVVLDLMIHDIDIILSIIDAEIEQILTAGAPVLTSLTDIANARIMFTNGCTANVTVSRVSTENLRRMRIFQPGCYLSVDFAKKEMLTIRLQHPGQGHLPEPEISNAGFGGQDQLEMELHDFIDHVRDRSRPAVSGREGRRALDVALRVIAQIEANQQRISRHWAEANRRDLLSSPANHPA